MDELLNTLRQDYPAITFAAGKRASWSPSRGVVTYTVDNPTTDAWSLLHELGHALARHESYESDTSLVQKEVEAWHYAVELASKYAVAIDPNHIEDCLDTYRDWLYKRSSCPTCGNHGLQRTQQLYGCLNCQTTWKVTSARFCRPYRLKKAQAT